MKKNKNPKERLFEMMQKVNPDFNHKIIKENINESNPSEEEIVKDILSSINENSLDEGLGDDVLRKIKDYGRRGLLTASIILMLMANVSGEETKKNIMDVGVNVIENNEKQLFYKAIIGLSTKYTGFSMKKSDMNAAIAFRALTNYYIDQYNGKTYDLPNILDASSSGSLLKGITIGNRKINLLNYNDILLNGLEKHMENPNDIQTLINYRKLDS